MNNIVKIQDGKIYIDDQEIQNIDSVSINDDYSRGFKMDISFYVKKSKNDSDE